MKIAHRILAVVAIAIISISGSVSANAQLRFGVKAGANFNKLKLSTDLAEYNSDNGYGWQAGVLVDFKIPILGFGFDAALQYTRMNSDVRDVINGHQAESNNNNFFEIPVNIKYTFSIPGADRVAAPMIYTGPDFAFRLGGDDDYFKTKSVQYGWNIGVGVELFSHLQISGGYCFGINNLLEKWKFAQETANFKLRNNYWTLNAAYLF